MDVNRILALPTSFRLDESRIYPLDLDSSLRFLLDVLDEESLRRLSQSHDSESTAKAAHSRSDNLCSNVEISHRLNIEEDFLFRPFSLRRLTLIKTMNSLSRNDETNSFSGSISISETTLVDERSQFLINELLNGLDSSVENLLRLLWSRDDVSSSLKSVDKKRNERQ